MITRQMTPFFLSTFYTLCVGIFHFCILRPLELNFLLCIMFWFVKYTFTWERRQFQAC